MSLYGTGRSQNKNKKILGIVKDNVLNTFILNEKTERNENLIYFQDTSEFATRQLRKRGVLFIPIHP